MYFMYLTTELWIVLGRKTSIVKWLLQFVGESVAGQQSRDGLDDRAVAL